MKKRFKSKKGLILSVIFLIAGVIYMKKPGNAMCEAGMLRTKMNGQVLGVHEPHSRQAMG